LLRLFRRHLLLLWGRGRTGGLRITVQRKLQFVCTIPHSIRLLWVAHRRNAVRFLSPFRWQRLHRSGAAITLREQKGRIIGIYIEQIFCAVTYSCHA
jgi:hypothetical protein